MVPVLLMFNKAMVESTALRLSRVMSSPPAVWEITIPCKTSWICAGVKPLVSFTIYSLTSSDKGIFLAWGVHWCWHLWRSQRAMCGYQWIAACTWDNDSSSYRRMAEKIWIILVMAINIAWKYEHCAMNHIVSPFLIAANNSAYGLRLEQGVWR